MKLSYSGHKCIEAIQIQRMEAISFLAAGLSHDINNLLMGVLHYTYAIERMNPNRHIQERLEGIIGCCEKMGEMLKRLMLLGKKPHRLKIELLDLNEEIKNTVKALQSVIPPNIKIKAPLCANLPFIYADATAIAEIVTNLMLNTIQAMPDGGLIEIKTGVAIITQGDCEDHANAYPGRFVVITIADNGPGIPEEILPKIFDSHFSTKGSHGLGLAIVYALVDKHGGWIHVESEVGKGTKFMIYFPLKP